MNEELKIKPEYILLSCCTYKRPKLFRLCLESILKLNFPQNIKTEMLIVDNDSEGSAKHLVDEFSKDFPVKIHYFVEEKRGLSNARNRLLSEAVKTGATHILMFDDDILLPENQLLNYLSYYEENKQAVIITAASYSVFTEPPKKYIEKNDLFKTSTTKKTGLVRSDCASGNVFFPTTLMSKLNLKFESQYVFMGGEDGKFFAEASEKGAVIVWCNACFNREVNDTDKTTVGWILKRSYYNGYSAAFGAVKRKNLFGRFLYTLKQNICLVGNCIILPFSICLGLTGIVNVLGFIAKSAGRVNGSTRNIPLDYYKTPYGG